MKSDILVDVSKNGSLLSMKVIQINDMSHVYA